MRIYFIIVVLKVGVLYNLSDKPILAVNYYIFSAVYNNIVERIRFFT